MSEKPSQPSSANGRVYEYARVCALLLGCAVVLLGIFDICQRAYALTAGAPVSEVTATDALPIDPMATANTGVLGTPVRLVISSIGVNATVEALGTNTSGAMATPKKVADVSWYSLGSKPGESGNAVFAGHVNNALTTAGVFFHLAEARVGDVVEVYDASGSVRVYHITRLAQYQAGTAPTQTIFATTGPSQVVLITCAGDWVPSAHSFDTRLVVYAE